MSLYLMLGAQQQNIDGLEQNYRQSLLHASPHTSYALEQWLKQTGVDLQRKHGIAHLRYSGDMTTWTNIVNRLSNAYWLSWQTKILPDKTVEGKLTIKDL